mmetsp:Transcript_25884/g.45974  ORF Transcript_25884/g.45974 Transcript_25884/m.45974 type:complete len:222 (-) Transcript_25884:284-949(-)|eukprot:CAMPEP_0197527988 /NCGR_PEP_ID=MMETSP1318-20131121/23484_1 /TAXON_ID=552666 /ORGANISM="Partenskyella glossopodia, Strain RCC365" /LENGTH=221 /DNA_ID=CAMNT_0043082885 /DNA_START=132 /DNA_END=797 /DNA_ORIENTATION=-
MADTIETMAEAEKSFVAEEGKSMAESDNNGIKVILLGDSAVGKSKLIERFLMDKYVPLRNSTYALTIFRHKALVDGKSIDIDFYDTAGQERFASMHPSYYFRAQSCVLVFDVSRKITYKNLMQWYKELKQYRPDIPIICVANKIDLNAKATQKKFKFATARNLPLYYCSAADGTNVVRVFKEAIKLAVDTTQKPSEDFTEEVMRTLEYFDMKEKKEEQAKT